MSDAILVTGGNGAIGNYVTHYLALIHKDRLIVNIDAQTYAAFRDPDILTLPNYRLVVGNICHTETVMNALERFNPSIIIHLAAETHVDTSFGNSYHFTETNVFGTHTLLECCRKYGRVQKFIHMSTDEVYGEVDDDTKSTTTSLLAPTNPYSASKAAAEMFCHAYIKSFNLPIIIIRCNNAISKYQHPEKLIPRVVSNILSKKKIPIHGKGESKRTFVHAMDIARAIDIITNHGEIGAIYNIGTHQEYTVLEVVKAVYFQMLGTMEYFNEWLEYIPDRAFQDRRYSVDTKELEKLGWKPIVSFNEAIKDVIDFYVNQRPRQLNHHSTH